MGTRTWGKPRARGREAIGQISPAPAVAEPFHALGRLMAPLPGCWRARTNRCLVAARRLGIGDGFRWARGHGRRSPMNNADLGEVLFEFRRVGAVVKVSAIHVRTDTEVCLVGAPAAGETALKMAAIRKLIYVLGQRQGGAEPGR